MHNKEQNYLSIVVVLDSNIRLYTEINQTLDTLYKFCEDNFFHYEFILVDNNAPKEIVHKIISHLTDIKLHANLVTLPYEANKESAVLAGIDATIGDYVFEFTDTKLDYSSDDLWNMYQMCLEGNDIVLLKPQYKPGFLEQMFYSLLAKYSNKNSILYPSKFNLISRRAINRVHSINKKILYRKYAYCNSGLKYKFIESTSKIKIPKQHRLSWDKIDFATDLLLIFTNMGKRIAILFSLLFTVISILAITYTIIAYVTTNVIEGWTTLMLLLSISFTGIFFCLSIVIKYLNLLLIQQQSEETAIASKKRI